ncbi:MAG: M67 family metallopeptidase [Candidatus Poribacteria bacterium]|nr:M67 family metallopeptidase [Candidatus Poribacteria bacterium]
MQMLTLQPETLSEIYAHAKSEFPDECCGAILSDGTQEFVWKCRNIQNALHQKDPDTYPRDARTAYVIHPDDLIAIHKETETQNRQIKVFYHSHPNHEAYFSEKDKADAMMWDEPAYPDATYLVISVYDAEIRAVKAFAYDETAKDFIDVPLAGT